MSDNVIQTHRECGLRVYRYRVNRERSTVTWEYANLDAVALPEPVGDADLTDDDEAVIGTAGTGIYTTHQCPARVLSCRRCGAPIIKVTRRYDGSRWRFTLLEVLPDADGEFVLDENGHATPDLGLSQDGLRYAVHRDSFAHQRPANPNPLGLPRHVKPGLAPSSVRHVFKDEREVG